MFEGAEKKRAREELNESVYGGGSAEAPVTAGTAPPARCPCPRVRALPVLPPSPHYKSTHFLGFFLAAG